MSLETIVIPAKAGIFFAGGASQKKIPAFAGMTSWCVNFHDAWYKGAKVFLVLFLQKKNLYFN
jgi:hypothetical protein